MKTAAKAAAIAIPTVTGSISCGVAELSGAGSLPATAMRTICESNCDLVRSTERAAWGPRPLGRRTGETAACGAFIARVSVLLQRPRMCCENANAPRLRYLFGAGCYKARYSHALEQAMYPARARKAVVALPKELTELRGLPCCADPNVEVLSHAQRGRCLHGQSGRGR